MPDRADLIRGQPPREVITPAVQGITVDATARGFSPAARPGPTSAAELIAIRTRWCSDFGAERGGRDRVMECHVLLPGLLIGIHADGAEQEVGRDVPDAFVQFRARPDVAGHDRGDHQPDSSVARLVQGHRGFARLGEVQVIAPDLGIRMGFRPSGHEPFPDLSVRLVLRRLRRRECGTGELLVGLSAKSAPHVAGRDHQTADQPVEQSRGQRSRGNRIVERQVVPVRRRRRETPKQPKAQCTDSRPTV